MIKQPIKTEKIPFESLLLLMEAGLGGMFNSVWGFVVVCRYICIPIFEKPTKGKSKYMTYHAILKFKKILATFSHDS